MAREFTKAQQSAMDERRRTLLVSAAAGSGKTAVLTERIIRSLTDKENPTDISRLLIVTFTRAAAGELRQRISRALTEALAADPENRHLTRQLMLLGGARISTIDSFYLDLVRANIESTELPSSFRMADDAELLSLRRDTMSDVIDRMYRECEDFYRISDLFCRIRSEESLTDTLVEITGKLEKYPAFADFLLNSATVLERGADKPLSTPFGRSFADELERLATGGALLFAHALAAFTEEAEADKLRKKYGELYTETLDRCNALLAALKKGDLTDVLLLLAKKFEGSLRGGRGMGELSPACTEYIALCAEFHKKFKALSEAFGVFSAEEVEASALETASLLRILHRAISLYLEEYRLAKRQREICEFSDISRAAFRLLVEKNGEPTPLARELSKSFDAIYIDEYQDTDAMQDATFRAISTPRNRFMVGDIKQSIYRFRGAQPAVFASYRHAFPLLEEAKKEDAAAAVLMSNCFRCDENVIRFSNAVSGHLFSTCAKAIGYTKEDDLIFSKKPPCEDYRSPKCRLMLVERAKKQEREDVADDRTTAEARMIAREIHRLIREETKADGTPIRPSDIAVLFRSDKIAAALSRELAAYHIAANDASKKSFFENPEVLCVYSLLATIDNPERDIHLAATLRSPFFGFTLEDLVAIRRAGGHELSLYRSLKCVLANGGADAPALYRKCLDFERRLQDYCERAEALSVDKLLRYLYRETTAFSITDGDTLTEEGARARRANLRRLLEYARKFEANGFRGLFGFVRYIDDIMKNNTAIPTPTESPNAVSLITIHHSKGLEFPVCFIANAAASFQTKDQSESFISIDDIGAAFRLPNAGAFSHANTFWRECLRMTLARLEKEDEMRVLYVAMTRARERLYVTGSPTYGTEGCFSKSRIGGSDKTDLFAADGSSFLDFILAGLQKTDYEPFCELDIYPELSILSQTPPPCDTLPEEAVSETDTSPELLRQRFSFTYPFEHLTKLPAKLSVSRLTPDVLDVFDTDNAPDPDELLAPNTEALLRSFDRTPRFGAARETTAAERGTATHEFLQFCDYERAAADPREELERLIAAHFLPCEARQLVRLDELARFFESELFHSLSHAREIHRETRFNIFLPAAEFTESPTLREQLQEELLMVQGVIDLFFIDGDGRLVLCDYKTDRLPPEALRSPALAAKILFERHGRQLTYYAKALERMIGRAPDTVLIYSLPLGMALERP